MMYLITYDISNDKTRTKVADILEKFGKRVQFSCFEVECTEKELSELFKRIDKLINKQTDHVIAYPLTKNSLKGETAICGKREEKTPPM
ncbi:CRISPR-associated protein Cas2 [Thermovibrio ammonificans HB-1]|uniref:CRISPR-associated endoribonuclease Cas2 n=1 Tax=Thermovibrio ammonificans (strain DSM 15698 / JCM 12110 / HB-1) TaxID=648996 RepID=E8T4N5_THEA1|nr:CRISPR-associated protein Cas2 [Thermovibrio ammonificans HB-1]